MFSGINVSSERKGVVMSNGKERILFLDENEAVLNDLKRELAFTADQWDMTFSIGSDDAIKELVNGDYCVVVTDHLNRNVGGEDFMERARKAAPEVARVILSDDAPRARLHRIADDDHFYLRKGCTAEQLATTIDEACELHRWMQVHPRPPTAEELLEILIDFFTKELLSEKMSLRDVPDGIKPYLSRALVKSLEHRQPDMETEVEPLADDLWIIESGWPDKI